RPSILPAGLLFTVGRWYLSGQFASRVRAIRLLTRLFIPLAAATLFLGWYNVARFGDPLDMGYAYILEASDIKERFLQYGNFSLAFFPENLFIATLKPPFFHLHCLRESCLLVEPNPVGMGFIWTSPLLLYALLALRQNEADGQQNGLLAACV